MKEKEYIARLFDKTLEFGLKSKGAVLVVGPKSCGKSTTAKRQGELTRQLNNRGFPFWLQNSPSRSLSY